MVNVVEESRKKKSWKFQIKHIEQPLKKIKKTYMKFAERDHP